MATVALQFLLAGSAFGQESQPPVLSPGASQITTRSNPPAKPGGDIVRTWSDVEKNIWQNARPYIDLDLPAIRKQVPELEHLSPAANQDELNSILARVGEQCVDMLKRTPNVIADEHVDTYVSHMVRHQRYSYLVLVNHSGEGSTLREYRTDSRGTPVSESGGSEAQGYASMWTHFFPANQEQSRFRYLGTQKLDKLDVMVVAFAQIPDKVRSPSEFSVQGRHVAILYQGVAWIEPQTWRIVRLREDLLAPRPDAQLTKFTAWAHYGPVNLKKAQAAAQSGATLWLPQEADLDWMLKDQEGRERHIYSNYRLYATKSRIVF